MNSLEKISLSRAALVLFALLLAPLLYSLAFSPPEPPQAKPLAFFTDEAAKAGLTMKNVFGGVDSKKYIIETTGTGVAIFDFDNDGWPDIFVVNGTTPPRLPVLRIISTTTIMTARSPT